MNISVTFCNFVHLQYSLHPISYIKVAVDKGFDKLIEGNGNVESMTQDQIAANAGEPHSAQKLYKENCVIYWNKSAQQVHDFIIGLSPIWTLTDTSSYSYLVHLNLR